MKKTVAESRTEQVQIVSLGMLNGFKRLFGGKLMEWIDVVAVVVARRHCGCNVTTAVVDTLEFQGAAYTNDTIVLDGYITYVGNTSMEVCVKTYVEEFDGQKGLINTAYLVMVAIDENERPTKVPELIITNEEEQREWDEAAKRASLRKRTQKDK